MSVGSLFQACGPVVENALEPNAVRDRGMSKRPSCAERRKCGVWQSSKHGVAVVNAC